MPDTEQSSSAAESAGQTEPRNLPVPVPQVIEAPSEEPVHALVPRVVRLAQQLHARRSQGRAGGRRAERNRLLARRKHDAQEYPGLRERRIADVMVPRADIIAVQKDIALGELVKVFEKAEHSRLVVYDDTLDDPVGMVHIRDLIAFMTARAASKAKTKRKKPLVAGLDFGAIDLSMTLSAAKLVRTILFVPPSMPAIDLLAKMQTTRIHLALVVDEYGGTDGIVSIEDIVEADRRRHRRRA